MSLISIFRRAFSVKRNENLIEFLPGDLTSAISFKGEVYPVVVLENSVANEQKLTALVSSSGRISYSSNNFLRFWRPGFIEDVNVLESRDRLQGKLKGFTRDVLAVFEQNKETFRAATYELMKSQGYLYEEDLFESVFERRNEFTEGAFAIHKFLFESNENWMIKDGQWSLNLRLNESKTLSSGPYVLRPEWQKDLLKEVRSCSMQSADIERFRSKVAQSLKTKTTINIETYSEKLFIKCLKVFGDEFYINAQSNPFKEAVQSIFMGVAIVDSQVQARELLEKICGVSDQLDASRPFLNSFVSNNTKTKEFGSFLIKQEDRNESKLEQCDFGELPVYLIDPKGTVEVDDGISVERTNCENEAILHVHVADPCDHVTGETEREARRRAGSLYLPEMKIPMLPGNITDLSTLKSRGIKTMTFSCKVDLITGELKETKIREGRINNLKHFTYEEAEGIKDNLDVELLKKISEAHFKFRLLHGHLDFSFPRGQAHLDRPNRRILVKLDDDEVKMKKIVAEAMIIAGRIAGESLKGEAILAPFRTHPGLPKRIENCNPSGLLQKYELLKLMLPASISPESKNHSLMGLEAYVKVTSPLRRYLDLVTHKILKNRHSNQFGPDWFTSNLPKIRRQELYNKRISSAVNRYWIERYIWQEIHSEHGSNSNKYWSLTPLERIKEGLWSVHVEDVASNFIVQLRTSKPINLGESIKGRIISQSFESILRFQV